jgi:hypothetical protein
MNGQHGPQAVIRTGSADLADAGAMRGSHAASKCRSGHRTMTVDRLDHDDHGQRDRDERHRARADPDLRRGRARTDASG